MNNSYQSIYRLHLVPALELTTLQHRDEVLWGEINLDNEPAMGDSAAVVHMEEEYLAGGAT